MPSSPQLASIATSLDTYRTQFAALGDALSALREVSDQMIAQLDRDRAALETHLQAAMETIAQTEASDTAASALDSLDVESAQALVGGAVSEAESDVQDVAETSAETSSVAEAEAVVAPAIDSETITACESVAAATDEPAVLEAEPLALADDTTEATSETATVTETSAPIATATDAPALATPGEANATPAGPTGNDKVISLVDRRRAKTSASPARRRAIAVVASILITAGATFGLHELLHTELGQRMLELATCDGDMLSASRDCNLLSWLTI